MGIWSATSTLFSDALAAILHGTPFGAVHPPKVPPPLPGEDGRTHALRALRAYVSEIPFRDPRNPANVLKIEQSRFQLEMPETPKNLLFPSIAVVEGESELRPIGLTPYIDESSLGLFGPGTALEVSWEYAERITLEIWADTRALRRALAAGIESALSPSEEIGGIRLEMPDYFGQTVRFTPMASGRLDGDLAGDRRRRATLLVMMEFNLVRLVNVATMKPQAIVVVQDPTAPG